MYSIFFFIMYFNKWLFIINKPKQIVNSGIFVLLICRLNVSRVFFFYEHDGS